MSADVKLSYVKRVGQLLKSLRAGLATQLVGTFLVLLVLGPYHAAHSEFPGHEHPPGTPDHVHSLEMVTGWMVVSHILVVVVSSLPMVGFTFLSPGSWFPQALRLRVNGSRSPPAALLIA